MSKLPENIKISMDKNYKRPTPYSDINTFFDQMTDEELMSTIKLVWSGGSDYNKDLDWLEKKEFTRIISLLIWFSSLEEGKTEWTVKELDTLFDGFRMLVTLERMRRQKYIQVNKPFSLTKEISISRVR